MRLGLVCVVAALASACTQPAPEGSDAHELANFAQSNLMPKSSPRQVVATFEKACLNGFATESDMRSAGFVPLPRDDKATAYVSDDTRPNVAMTADGKGCSIAAASRTGQTDALRAMVAERFPDARPMDGATAGRLGVEQGWMVDGAAIYLQRKMPDFSRMIFGIVRTA